MSIGCFVDMRMARQISEKQEKGKYKKYDIKGKCTIKVEEKKTVNCLKWFGCINKDRSMWW